MMRRDGDAALQDEGENGDYEAVEEGVGEETEDDGEEDEEFVGSPG